MCCFVPHCTRLHFAIRGFVVFTAMLICGNKFDEKLCHYDLTLDILPSQRHLQNKTMQHCRAKAAYRKYLCMFHMRENKLDVRRQFLSPAF